jgi:hypothetical protein
MWGSRLAWLGGELRGGGDEFLGVRLAGMFADIEHIADLDQAALLHDGDAVAEVAHERHGVRDEEAGEVVGALQVAEQVDDLGADRDVEGADRRTRNSGRRARARAMLMR